VEWSGGLSGLLLWHGTGGGTLVRACSSYPWAAVAGAAHQRLCVGKGSGCPRDLSVLSSKMMTLLGSSSRKENFGPNFN
jgi:hypothetical protein